LLLRYSIQQYLAAFLFFFIFCLVVGSGSGSVFIRRSGLAILHHGLLDLPALLLLRPEQLLAFIQMIKKRADGRGARLLYPCSKLNNEVGDDPCCGNTDLVFFCSRPQNSTKIGSLKFGNK
jgi:hypothetical protein